MEGIKKLFNPNGILNPGCAMETVLTGEIQIMKMDRKVGYVEMQN